MLSLLILLILVVLFIGGLPKWGYSANWGYKPSGILGVILIIFILMMLFGMVPF